MQKYGEIWFPKHISVRKPVELCPTTGVSKTIENHTWAISRDMMNHTFLSSIGILLMHTVPCSTEINLRQEVPFWWMTWPDRSFKIDMLLEGGLGKNDSINSSSPLWHLASWLWYEITWWIMKKKQPIMYTAWFMTIKTQDTSPQQKITGPMDEGQGTKTNQRD